MMKKVIKIIYLIGFMTLVSCEDKGGGDINRLTNGGRTLPTGRDVVRHIDDQVSPLKPPCGIPKPRVTDSADGSGACDIAGTSSSWRRNCKSLINSRKVPKGAFLYALKVMKKNSSSFKSNKCYQMASSSHYSMRGLTKNGFEGLMNKGIPNKCQMMINNYDERITTHNGTYKCKAANYYIDLCSSSPKVTKSFSYVGYGTCKNGQGFKNQSGKGTTLLGAFMTSNKEFNFQKRDASYSRIARQLGGKVPAVPLIGLQKSNNRSARDYKYLHVGAYTSAGCPSIPPQNASMVRALAKNGPSLVVNYKSGQMEDINRCSR